MWFVAGIFIAVFSLFLPLEWTDTLDMPLVFAEIIGSMFCFSKGFRRISPKHATLFASFISIALVFGVGWMDKVRRDFLFDTRAVVVEGRVSNTDKSGWLSKKTRYYIHYNYVVNGEFFEREQHVDYDVYFNFDVNKISSVQVEYVEGRPSIARIKPSSLVPYPDLDDLFRQFQQEKTSEEDNIN